MSALQQSDSVIHMYTSFSIFFSTPYLRLFNIVGEWLSLRKCLNIASHFNRCVMKNTPAAVACSTDTKWLILYH